VDMHRAVPKNLNEVLSWEKNGCCKATGGGVRREAVSVGPAHEALSLVQRKVIVRTLRQRAGCNWCIGSATQVAELPAGQVRKPRERSRCGREKRKRRDRHRR